MKTLYIECNMGAAGDMLMSALYELLEDKEGFLSTMNSLGLPGVHLEAASAVTSGISGTHMKVTTTIIATTMSMSTITTTIIATTIATTMIMSIIMIMAMSTTTITTPPPATLPT